MAKEEHHGRRVESASAIEFSVRRAFGKWLVAAATVVPARLLGTGAPSNRLRVGQIGCGRTVQVDSRAVAAYSAESGRQVGP